VDSARANLATTFVNAFVNAGFGQDKLVTAVSEDEKVRAERKTCNLRPCIARPVRWRDNERNRPRNQLRSRSAT